ncbi:hypothetical protein ACFVYE_19035 [Streptomyces sp. NPDC058239]|uniref:hypothetical protein n=1 Tax=unclassified Streptomyces TaxID=2593676 RepID=UPI00365438A4
MVARTWKTSASSPLSSAEKAMVSIRSPWKSARPSRAKYSSPTTSAWTGMSTNQP